VRHITKWGPYDADDPRKDYVVRGHDANDRQVYANADAPDTRECTLPYTKTSLDGNRVKASADHYA
jgi:hypothetical protein